MNISGLIRASIVLTSLLPLKVAGEINPKDPKKNDQSGFYSEHQTTKIPTTYSDHGRMPSQYIKDDPDNRVRTIASTGSSDNDHSSSINLPYPFSSAGVPRQSNIDSNFHSRLDMYQGDDYGSKELPNNGSESHPFLDAMNRHDYEHQMIDNFPPLRTPIVYRYYSRRKTRSVQSGSVPFILLGPNVDHWKIAGQQLSSRGFNVIAVGPKDDKDRQRMDRIKEGPGLVLQLMDAMRWNKVVLVGCDSESAVAIQAAMHLAPHRVSGLVLCGNLDSCEDMIRNSRLSGTFAMDHYLQERLQCPFLIVWDGSSSKKLLAGTLFGDSSAGSDLTEQKYRIAIIGGGSAPHRRRPEIFAWSLTRFVEEKIAPAVKVDSKVGQRPAHERKRYFSAGKPRVDLPWKVSEIINEESFVVFGRVAATALFYGMALKVLFYQYGNLRSGVTFMRSAQRKTIASIQNAVLEFGSLFLFLRKGGSYVRRKILRLDDDESSVAPHDEEPENDAAGEDAETPSDPDTEPEPSPQMPDNKRRPIIFLDHVVA